jgi:predicted nucleic acid-binding protein
MNMRLADSNIILNAVVAELFPTPDSVKAAAYLEEVGAEGLCLPSTVFYELETVFYRVVAKQYKFPADGQVRLIAKFRELYRAIYEEAVIFPLFFEDEEYAMEIYSSQQTKYPKLSLIDCTLLALGQRTGLKLLTFDTNLIAAAKKLAINIATV